jgi:hypothetical protein
MMLNNCGAPYYLKRYIKYGDQKLNKELDLVHLVTLIKQLEKLVKDPEAVENDMCIDLDTDEF